MLFCRKKKEITGRNKETVKNSTESRRNRAAASGSSPGPRAEGDFFFSPMNDIL